MKGKVLLCMTVMLVAAGCNLTVNVGDNPPPADLPPTQQQPVVERPTDAAATVTPRPTSAPATVAPTTAPTCVPRADWPLYTVASGDTLGQIAVRAGTSTAALIQANCLTNANLISIGQQVRVPRQPTPPTVVVPTVVVTKPAQQVGSIGITKYLWADAGNFVLPGGEQIAVSWDGGPADALRTDFFLRTSSGALTLIGSDTNPADGLRVLWQAQINFVGEITASAIRPDGSTAIPIFKPSVSVSDPNGSGNAITLNTYLRVESGAYILKAGQAEVITWAAAPLTATRIDFVFAPGDHSAARALGSVTPAQGGTSVSATFAANEYGVISAEAFLRDGTHLFFARPITIKVEAPAPPPEATAEPTAEATPAQ